jgi:antitoxin component YwqK of YwqJK toxin-antitoxin module
MAVLITQIEGDYEETGIPCTYNGAPFSGECIENDSDGNKIWSCQYLEGKKHGVEISYSPDGKVLESTEHYLGIPHGFFKMWNIQGELEYESFIQYGTRLWYKKFENGELFYESAIDKNSSEYRFYSHIKKTLEKNR